MFLLTWLHPGWGLDSAAAGIPLVSGSALALMKTSGPLHQCPGRHEGRRVLRAAVDDNRHRLDQYDGLFRALGLDPAERARKRELKLIRGGDSNPGRRVSLPA